MFWNRKGACFRTNQQSPETAQVWKPEKHGAHMAHKGYNGRVLVLWLADCMERLVSQTTTADRAFCQWLAREHADNGRPWPNDEMRNPIAVAMILLLMKYMLTGVFIFVQP